MRIVKPNAVKPGTSVFHGIPDHDSFLLCPGKPAMKLDTSFPVSRVRVFYRKLESKHDKLKSLQNSVHYAPYENSEPRNYIDIYHWTSE